MKKVILLTASTGAGHNRAARSLEKYYIKNGYKTKIIDIFKETSEIMDLIIADGYKLLVNNLPKLYGAIYDIFDSSFLNQKVFKNNLVFIKRKLLKEINSLDPDVIVSTHPFAVGIISALKEKRKINSKFISVVTDFKAHYAYITSYVDAYITGSDYTKKSLVSRGIDEKKIYSYGIPIKSEFYDKKSLSKKTKDKFYILLMGGSLGSKGILKVLNKMDINNNNIKVITVCGKNNKLQKKLIKKFDYLIKDDSLEVLGYTDKIPNLMEICDLIITKPGGLTTTEALFKKIPMIIPFAYPGQEVENTDFLVKKGVAIKINELDEINEHLDEIINNQEYYEKMRNKIDSITSDYSVEKIIELTEKLVTV